MAGPKSKKQKTEANRSEPSVPNTYKPSAVFRPSGGRAYTLSIALPGSIIANAVTHDQKTSLAGQIARACAVFCVDEIVVFDDGQAEIRAPEQGGYTAFADPNFFLYHVLTYLETPPHLRKALFPLHPDLRTAGSLPSLDMPHHMRSDEWCRFREAITLSATASVGAGRGSMVDCGLDHRVVLSQIIEPDTRVTIQLTPSAPDQATRPLIGEAVSPDTPRTQEGYYWGYTVRQAASLGSIFTECPYDGGYDVSIGTSERGRLIDNVAQDGQHFPTKSDQHTLVVFGGVAGLEAALSADSELQAAGVGQVEDLFDHWLNLVPGQGSRTIRTEEAVWVGLTELRRILQ